MYVCMYVQVQVSAIRSSPTYICTKIINVILGGHTSSKKIKFLGGDKVTGL